MMEKRGISPLIATVLILGFTVALAAVIMTWGTAFTKKMQEQTEETSGIQVTCATDVIFDIKSVCKVSAGEYKVIVSNDGKEKIWEWKFRLYKSDVDVTPGSATGTAAEIDPFGLKTIPITPTVPLVKKIEAIPVIKMGGKLITCSQNIDSYGDTGSTDTFDTSPACPT